MATPKTTEDHSRSRAHADFLALAITYGFVLPDAAVDWACTVIVAEEEPDPVLVELAGLIRPEPREVRELLECVPGMPDDETHTLQAFRRLLALVLQQIEKNERSVEDAALRLRSMADADAVPEVLASPCTHFDYEFMAAHDEWPAEDAEDVRERFMDFLRNESATHP